MKKIYLEIVVVILFVTFGTIFTYSQLANVAFFWNNQLAWSFALIILWSFVSAGYFHQGWIIHIAKSCTNVSLMLPITVFIVQCILFVKGIYYHDWSLIIGAIIVNSGVTFNIWQILKFRNSNKKII